MGWVVAILVALYLYTKGFFSSFLGGSLIPGTQQPQYPQAIPVAPQQGQQGAESAVAGGVSKGLAAIPVVGQAISQAFNLIAGGLIQASAKRRAQAVNENQAVAAAVPGWDAAIQQIVQGYNNGSLSASQVEQLIDMAWANYWSEVGNQIQPGRNGCQSGTLSKAQVDAQFPGNKQCSDSFGAACCVGYADLANANTNLVYAVHQADQTGKPSPAVIPQVFASKYGGTSRPGYTVTFTRPTGLFGL